MIIMDNERKTAGVYIRVSTDDQKDNGYSIDSQLRMIKEYCEKKNYDFTDVRNIVLIEIQNNKPSEKSYK